MSASRSRSKSIASQVAALISANRGHFTGLVKAEYQDLELLGDGGRGPARVLITLSDGSTYDMLVNRWN